MYDQEFFGTKFILVAALTVISNPNPNIYITY